MFRFQTSYAWGILRYKDIKPSNRSLDLVTTCPALFVAEHLISPSSLNAAWCITRVLESPSVTTLCLRLLYISNPSLYQTSFGDGVPWTSTVNSIWKKQNALESARLLYSKEVQPFYTTSNFCYIKSSSATIHCK